jgi:hypothetical protein
MRASFPASFIPSASSSCPCRFSRDGRCEHLPTSANRSANNSNFHGFLFVALGLHRGPVINSLHPVGNSSGREAAIPIPGRLRCHRSSSRPFVPCLHPYRERCRVEGPTHAQSGVSVSKPASPPRRLRRWPGLEREAISKCHAAPGFSAVNADRNPSPNTNGRDRRNAADNWRPSACANERETLSLCVGDTETPEPSCRPEWGAAIACHAF